MYLDSPDPGGFMAVAVDVQGPQVALPWVEAAEATFAVAIDVSGALSEAFGLDIVRCLLLLDEQGRLAVPPLRVDVDRDPEPALRALAWARGDGPPPEIDADGASTAGLDATRANGIAWLRVAELALADGDVEAASSALDAAWERMPDNVQVRKQRWALREPDRFYAGEIDLAWQDEQRALGR